MSARDAAVAASTELSRIKWSDGVHTVGAERSGVGVSAAISSFMFYFYIFHCFFCFFLFLL